MKVLIYLKNYRLCSCMAIAAMLFLSGISRAQPGYVPVPISDGGAFTLSGTLFKDGNGMTDHIINGTPYADEGEKMYVVITSNSFEKLGHALIVNGHYAFSGLGPFKYRIYITAYPDYRYANLPGPDWVATSDDTYYIDMKNGSRTDGNFGINRKPFANAVQTSVQLPIENPVLKFNSAPGQLPALSGEDLEDGVLGAAGNTSIAITWLPSNGQLYYDDPIEGNKAITETFAYITNYDPARMTFKFIDEGYLNSTFSFSSIDKSGTMGPSVDYVIIWQDPPVEEKLYSLSGNLFVDANGITDNAVNGEPYTGEVPMYATLHNEFNQKLGYKAIVDGKYKFTDIPAGKYYVNITNNGSNIYPELPGTEWTYTGENIGPVGYDSYVNGQLSVTITNADINEANFGIEKLPVSTTENVTIPQPAPNQLLAFDGKPGNLPALSGWDTEDQELGGKGSIVVFTKLPQTGELLYAGPENGLAGLSPVLEHLPITNYDPEKLFLRLSGSYYTSIEFSYAFVDAAGKRGPGNWYTISWDSPLPVILSSFKVSANENNALLQWSTTSEFNSDRFEIEHSTDAKNWTLAGTVKAQFESNGTRQYEFTHREVINGNNFYRLKMIDHAAARTNETFTYSRITQVSFKDNYSFTLYPNPATDHFTVQGAESLSDVKVNIYTNFGKLVSTSANKENVDVSHLPTGIYIVTLTNNNAILHSETIVVR